MRAITWFVKYSRFILILIFVVVVTTPFVLSAEVNVPLGQCVLTVLGIALGDSPSSFEELVSRSGLPVEIASPYAVWLLLVRFLGGMTVPVLVGIIVAEGQQEIEQRRLELFQREAQFVEVQQDIRELVREQFQGMDPTLDDGSLERMVDEMQADTQRRIDDWLEEGGGASRLERLRNRLRQR